MSSFNISEFHPTKKNFGDTLLINTIQMICSLKWNYDIILPLFRYLLDQNAHIVSNQCNFLSGWYNIHQTIKLCKFSKRDYVLRFKERENWYTCKMSFYWQSM